MGWKQFSCVNDSALSPSNLLVPCNVQQPEVSPRGWREGGRKTASDDDSPENEGESSRLSGTGTHRAAATWPLPSYPPLHLPLRHQPCIS